MEDQNQNFFNLLQKSNHPLIIPSFSSSYDNIATAFAIEYLLEKLQKKATIFLPENIDNKLSFLKKPKKIIKKISGTRDFHLIFDTTQNKIIKSSTEKTEDKYIIKITPEKGFIHPKDFSFIPAKFEYDLIVTIGLSSLENLNKIYLENSDLFFENPKINIDYSSFNENFGQLNLVNVASSSCAEIVANILFEKNQQIMDENIAQALLTGIVSATESFQKPTTSPQSMIMAAKLMKYQASQATIIQHLYKTKPLSFMKLWGKVMSRLNWGEKQKIAWSIISGEDFVQSHAGESDIIFVIEEIKKSFSQGKIFAVIYSYGSAKTKIQISVSDQKTRQEIINVFEENISKKETNIFLEFEENDLIKTEKIFLEKIKQIGQSIE